MSKGWNNIELPELDNYSNASGCFLKHPIDRSKRNECEKNAPKNINAQSELLTAQAVLAKVSQAPTETKAMSPLAITGIIFGSLMAITIMVVVIKKTRAKKA